MPDDTAESRHAPDVYEQAYMSDDPDQPVLREKMSSKGFIGFGLTGFFVLMALFFFALAFIAAPPAGLFVMAPLGLLMLLVGVFVLTMMTMRLNVTREKLVIHYGLFGSTIPLDAITRCEAVSYSALKQFGGWGIRYGKGGTKAYNIMGDKGKAVEVHYKEGGETRKLLFSSANPNWVADTVNRLRAGDAAAEPIEDHDLKAEIEALPEAVDANIKA